MRKERFGKYWIIFGIASIFVLFLMNFGNIVSGLSKLMQILTPFIAGLVIAYLVNLPYTFLCNKAFAFLGNDGFKSKIKKPVSLVLAYLLVIAIFAIILGIIIPELTKSVNMIIANIDVYIGHTEAQIKKIMEYFGQEYNNSDSIFSALNYLSNKISGSNLSEFAYSGFSKIFPHIYNITLDITSAIYNVVISVAVSVYMLTYKEKLINQLKKLCCALLPDKVLKFTVKVARISNEMIGKFLYGKIIDSSILGVICFICLTIFGFDYAALISILIGVTNIIPFFGPLIGAVPSVILLLLINPMEALWFILFVLLLQQFDGNILGPKIIGGTIGINGFFIVLGVVLGTGLFGFLGMILGVPFVAIVYALLGESVNKRLIKKNCTITDHTINMDGEILVTSKENLKKPSGLIKKFKDQKDKIDKSGKK